MPTNTLTDTKCRTAKPSEKDFKLFDGGGLYLFVARTGGKIWRVAYRLADKQQTQVLGHYPGLSLADARSRRDKLKVQLRDSIDPKAATRARKSVPTLGDASKTYWAGRRDVSDGYRANALNGLTSHLSAINGLQVSAITRQLLLAELMRMDAKGLYVYVRKIRVWVGQVLDWCVEQEYCEINPASLIRPDKAFGHDVVESHASLPLAEAGTFLQRIGMEGQLQSVLANRLLALTWVRTGELRQMRWSEIDGELWEIPKDKMKRRREHLVPLASQAMQLLRELRARTQSEYVFPSDRRLDRPMSENSILYLIHRCGYKDRMTGHGWRSMASTWANEHEYNKDAIERQLSHAPDDKIRAAYNKAEYMPLRRKMLQAWADWLDLQHANAGRPQR